MSVSKFLSILFKTTPALAISALLWVSHADAIQGQAAAPATANQTVNQQPAAADSSRRRSASNETPSTRSATPTSTTHFRPPSNPRPRSGPRTTTGTRRGACLGSTTTAFTLLGPLETVGQTVSTHPKFGWHLPDSEQASAMTFPVIFRLLAPDEEGIPTPIHVAELAYTPGFVNYQLPTSEPALTPGTEYRWQVIIECNPNYPSRALVQELAFEVVSPPAGLSAALATTTTDSAQAVIYGQEGLWYDAIAQVVEATTGESRQTRSGLLRDLAAAVAPDNQQLSQDILEIVEITDN
ncbi:MAG: DUF928 domain-containing protein [Cyanobacteria bacterium P01_G01_bin.38]